VEAQSPSFRTEDSRFRRWLRLALLVLGTVLLVVANAGYWVDNTLLDSDEFTEKVDGVLREPEATDRIADVLAQQALSDGRIQDRISNALPSNAGFLPFLLADELHDALSRTLARLLAADTAQDLLERAIRRMHDLVVSTLEGREGALDVEDGAFVLHLDEAVSNFLDSIGVSAPAALEEREVGTIVLVEDARSLDTASRLVRGVQEITPIVFVISILAFAGAVFLAENKSRGLITVGYSIVIAGVFSLIAWRLSMWSARAFLDEALVARMIIDSLASNLRLQSLFLAALGALIVVLADARIRGWIGRTVSTAWPRIETFGTSQATLLVAGGIALILIIS
jgi:hypothetical protein